MKINQWTKGLAAAGIVSIAGAVQAQDASETVMTAVSSTTLSGYVSTSAMWKPGTGNGASPGRVNDGAAKWDGFNLDLIDIKISKPLDEGEWSSGYTAELWLGPDAGLIGNPSAGNFGSSELAIKQANVQMRAPVGNGLDLTMGVFDTPLGFEYANNPDNPHFGIGLGWSISQIGRASCRERV